MSWTDLPDLTELLLRLGCAREQSRDARHKPEKIDGFIPTAPGKILHQLQLVHPEGLGVKALAQAVSLSPGAVSQTVQTLVDVGLIDRSTAPNDRRAVVMRLTDEGIRQIHRHEAMMNALLESLIAEAPPEDRAAFHRTLELGLAKARSEWSERSTAASSD